MFTEAFTAKRASAKLTGSGKLCRLVEVCLCVCIHLRVSKDQVGEAVLIPVGEPKHVFELQDLLSSQFIK